MSAIADKSTEREVLTEFLELYKHFTCLWDPSNELYTNKDARSQALQILLKKLQEIEREATILTVRKKIENMRAAYKREWKKVQSSRVSASGLGNVYMPSLWYYDYLSFLDDKGTLNKSTVDTVIKEDEMSETNISDYQQPDVKWRPVNALQDQHFIENVHDPGEDKLSESYGRVIGLQLKEMSKVQRCIAEKLISEVIFYGKLEKLSLNSSVTLEPAYDYPEHHQLIP